MAKNDQKIAVYDTTQPRRIGLLLIPGFAMMSYASAVEPLRAANVLAGKDLYRWRHISIHGSDIVASNGVRIQADANIGSAGRLDAIVVCAGGNPQAFNHPPTLAFLRKAARHGVTLGGVSAGPYLLAQAGVLEGYRCTVHWEHIPAFTETFPFLHLSRSLYELDRDRFTCAGGIAALDMMHAMIRIDHGAALASAVSDWFLQTEVRRGEVAQRLSPTERFGVRHPKLVQMLLRMEREIETPLSSRELSEIAGVSLRQLERLFARHLGTTIHRHYRRTRLEHARVLLRQTTKSIGEIALATGFAAPTQFSRSYRLHFGVAPAQERRGDPNARTRAPEQSKVGGQRSSSARSSRSV
ncbi:transcriptional regulator GlxA family with amidase domain [Bradyrhizobium sp. USDA 4524]|uniref:GlxA family transcriptional regulator n=1 Tax=unclassified Bradyrhizobium TaxID=2631580 RepID=UPI0020A20FA2|nr:MULTISPECIES: GlxA family transcriptional regulator [unclassified Bradyrhizobium]MCP1845666.1 transcriptional regulator GlxA family with amidase domain [Bradyrhizobium sp. USDA 4538]MCP1907010.1 transcriptional regulator GlxA family with amidase domain [Bradyrhizobium sp. USDA 4537]MCP1985486.1 transcriptional regulator GlxA family with amidase domain [Bradyrhizobium sp. USDA 4539]